MDSIKNWLKNENNREIIWIFIFLVLVILYQRITKPSCSSLYKGDWEMIESCHEERDNRRIDSYGPL